MYLVKESSEELWVRRERIRRLENERKKPPTLKHYREVLNTLRDFGIKISLKDIPEFSSFGDLERWQRKKILKSYN